MLVRWKKFEKIEEEAMNISLFSSVILFQMNSSYKLTTFTYSNNMKLENTVKIIVSWYELKKTLNIEKFIKQEMLHRNYNRSTKFKMYH